jgi:Ca2+-binding RTX toxin-like protein
MVPDNAIDTSANRTTSPLFPNTAQADLGISSGRSAVDSQFSKSHGLPSSLNSEITATSVFKAQNDDSLITGDGSGRIFADTGKDIINAPEAASSIFGGEGNKIITGSPGDDTIYAQAGNDIINGPFGNNRIASRPRQQPRRHR